MALQNSQTASHTMATGSTVKEKDMALDYLQMADAIKETTQMTHLIAPACISAVKVM